VRRIEKALKRPQKSTGAPNEGAQRLKQVVESLRSGKAP
jgi:hypothetical protein